jgi:hypothetical protein
MKSRPPYWRLVQEAAENLTPQTTRTEIRDYIKSRYPTANDDTISCHITICTVNHSSRIYYDQNKKPRLANSRYDFLFRTDARDLVLYNPGKHGQWEIRAKSDGGVVVALVGGEEFPPKGKRTRGGTGPTASQEQLWQILDRDSFLRGIEEYESREKRDAMYKVATFVVSSFWGRPADMADGLGVLLLTWNQAFYRYGMFDFDQLEECISASLSTIESFRSRSISGLAGSDHDAMRQLFGALLEALQIAVGKNRGRTSPVGTAKALHLLAPGFFPLWDDTIARTYGCFYDREPAEKYLSFCEITKTIAGIVRDFTDRSDRTVVKLIDEYNYAKFTQGWI